MFPWFVLPLLGAGIGAATSKKPLRGALLGGAAGAMPGLLGGAGAASAATNPALIESAVGTAGYGASSASPGLLGGALGMLDKYGAPAAIGLQLANQGRQLAAADRPQAAPMMPIQGNDVIGQMLARQAQLEELRRKQRYGIA